MIWDYDKKEYDKQGRKDPVWKLERALNYRPNGKEKLDKELLKKYLPVLKIPRKTHGFLEFLLWNKKL